MRPIDADALIEFCEERWIPLNIDAVNMQPTIQPEKEQLSCEGTTSDLISKTETVEHLRRMLESTVLNTDYDEGFVDGVEFGVSTVSTMPTIQPEQCGDKSYTLWKESYEELKRRMDELTSCSDLISRHAAIDLCDWYDNPSMRKDLEKLQSAQPEPHEGYWIRRDCGLDVECKCSKCGYRDFVEPGDEYWFKRNYCPNCGAKMTISK